MNKELSKHELRKKNHKIKNYAMPEQQRQMKKKP